MFFRQVLYRDLGCASYILGDGGEAVVVDPRWDIDVYLEIAAIERMRITHVLETHEHADHVSGRLALVAATGAQPHRAGGVADGITAGEEIAVGSLVITPMATPGHRPEHHTFAVADLSRSADPWMVLTGDSLLVGDVARPDLAVVADEGARELHASLRRVLALGDHVEVWPAHIGGSLCGGAGLSGKTSSTVGFERLTNPALDLSESAFVDHLIASLPSRPPNIDRIVELNRHSAPSSPPDPACLGAERLRALLAGSPAPVTVIDGRLPAEFDAAHIAGAINLPVSSPGVGTRAGWALDPMDPVLVVARDEPDARAMTSALQAVGFWRVEGVTIADPDAWGHAAVPLAHAHAWDLGQLVTGLRRDVVDLVDVREPPEWSSGHVAGSHHLPLHRLREFESLGLPRDDRTTAVACAAGVRAAFAASLLRRAGRRHVVRVSGGGIPDLRSHGMDLTVGT